MPAGSINDADNDVSGLTAARAKFNGLRHATIGPRIGTSGMLGAPHSPSTAITPTTTPSAPTVLPITPRLPTLHCKPTITVKAMKPAKHGRNANAAA
ncbi:MAG: hypothetical protein EBU31_16660, partial [Proteobacteria bacterium]|nr:hypothetical protein [Pseudomonadota bacterium]